MSTVIVAERKQLKPRQKRELQASGIIVLEVDDISKIKIASDDKEHFEDDGFNLNAESA